MHPLERRIVAEWPNAHVSDISEVRGQIRVRFRQADGTDFYVDDTLAGGIEHCADRIIAQIWGKLDAA